MMKKIILYSLLIINLFSSCKYGLNQVLYRDNPVEERSNTISEFELIDSYGQIIDLSIKNSFSFILIVDPHYGKNTEYIDKEFISYIKQMNIKPDFCVSLGDIVEHGLEDEYKLFTDSIVIKLEELGIKTYFTVENHDLYNSGWKNYTEYCYPYSSFYYIKSGNYSFYFLDSASGLLSEPQMTSLKKTFNMDLNKKFIFSHFSLYSENSPYYVIQDVEERNDLFSLFSQNNVIAYFGAHIHADRKTDFGSFYEISVPAFLEQRAWAICTVNIDDSPNKFNYEIFVR